MILYFNKLPSIKILGLYDYDCPQTIIENVPEDYGRYPHQDDCTIYHACYKVSTLKPWYNESRYSYTSNHPLWMRIENF